MGKKRTEKVTDRIFSAVCDLLLDQGKEYNEITIKEIIEEAGVCRNSFNRNYLTKDDIFIKKFNELYGYPQADHVKLDESITQRQLIGGIFRTVRKNQRFFLAFYKANPRKYYEMISKHIIASNTERDVSTLTTEEYYTYACKAWICIGLLTEWLQRGCDSSIEEIIDLLIHFRIQE